MHVVTIVCMLLQWCACYYNGMHVITIVCMLLQWCTCYYNGVHVIYNGVHVIKMVYVHKNPLCRDFSDALYTHKYDSVFRKFL